MNLKEQRLPKSFRGYELHDTTCSSREHFAATQALCGIFKRQSGWNNAPKQISLMRKDKHAHLSV